VERHLRSPDLAGVNDATPSDAPYAPWQCANTRTAITPPPFPRKADGRACCEQATAAPPPRACPPNNHPGRVLGHHPRRVIHASGSTARSPPCRAARSYVIRVIDGTTGVSKPKWVGGFATEPMQRQRAMRPVAQLAEASTSIAAASRSVSTYTTGWTRTPWRRSPAPLRAIAGSFGST
jgi:hypothetical protein